MYVNRALPLVIVICTMMVSLSQVRAQQAASGVEFSEVTSNNDASVVSALEQRPVSELRRVIVDEATDAVERQAALAELRAQSNEGNAQAAFQLAEILRNGEGLQTDIIEAERLYIQSFDAGEARAGERLGDLIIAGVITNQPLSQALVYYQSIAESRPLVNQKIGDIYRFGRGVEASAELAEEFYSRAIAADSGNQGAALRLADLYADATVNRQTEAMAIYQSLVDQGNATAAVRLGNMYRDGRGVAVELERAEALYNTAIAGGNDGAILQLTSLYLRNDRNIETAIAMLKEAVGEGMPGAATQLANAYLSGQGVAASAAEAIAVLEKGIETKDATAARRLFRLYVDGRGSELPRNLVQARILLERVAPILGADFSRRETLILDAMEAKSPSEWSSLLTNYERAQVSDKVAAVERVGRSNQNTYVMLLQHHLREIGLYNGGLSGQLTQSTISAFNALCREQNKTAECSRGPLSAPARSAFREILADLLQ